MEYLLGLVVVIIIVQLLARKPSHCDICGNDIKRSYHRWTVNGKKVVACPNCNRRLESKSSKDAVNRLLVGK